MPVGGMQNRSQVLNNSLVKSSVASVLVLLASTLLSHSASAQNVADNIRPVGSVCLAEGGFPGQFRVQIRGSAGVVQTDR